MLKSNIKLREFIEEAKALTQQHSFSGSRDKAMFWGHTADIIPQFSQQRNNVLCALYTQSADPKTYKLDSLDVIDPIGNYFDRWASDYPAEILDEAWDIYSEAFANEARGNHIFVAANDMQQNDFFERIELPIIKDKFLHVTTLEPAITPDHMFSFKKTKWSMNDWLDVQQVQWHNHYYYLDGNPYPLALIPPDRRRLG